MKAPIPFPEKAHRSGFSLIEVLAAVAILMVVVLFLGQVFTESTKIFSLSTKRSYSMLEGRAVMDLLTR